ncbi:hypothetical protein PG984_009732 [Apiospora sp. TS-2023a]
MDIFGDNPFIEEDPNNGRIPEEVFDLTMLDDNSDNPQTGNGLFAVRVKQEDDRDSLFVSHDATSPEKSQAPIKSEPDASGELEQPIKAEDDLDDRSLQEAPTGGLHDESRKGEPILISDDDDDEPEADWELRENRNGYIVFRNKSNIAAAKRAEPNDDVETNIKIELLTEDLNEYILKRDRLQAQLVNRPGSQVERTRLEQIEARITQLSTELDLIKSSTQSKRSEEEVHSDSDSGEALVSTSEPQRGLARNAREWWGRKYEVTKDTIARKRNILYQTPIPAPKTPRKKRKAAEGADSSVAADQGLKRLFSTQTTSELMEARNALQDLPEAGELSAATKTQQLAMSRADASKNCDDKVVRMDMRKLEMASRSFGLNNCKPTSNNWASTRWSLKDVKSTLLNHQLIGASWMLSREFGEDRGGINADEMGLGKTVQTLVCIAHNTPKPTDPKATLIVAPSSAIEQWMSEIRKHLPIGGDFSVIRFKASKDESEESLGKHDIIVTSYHELLGSHLPRHIREDMKSSEYTLEQKEDMHDLFHGVLFRMRFWRVVLDEAHVIKNHASQTSIVCRELKAEYRWALSGTPLQNTPEEMWPYLAFLHVPWAKTFKEFRHMLGHLADPINKKRLRAIVEAVMIRRASGDTILGQPLWKAKPVHVDTKWIQHTKEEKIIYRCVEGVFRAILNRIMNALRAQGKQVRLCDIEFYIVFLLRLRQATAHPFLLEPAIKNNLSKADILWMQSETRRIGPQTPVFEQIKLFHTEGAQDQANRQNQASGVFGASQFGYELDMNEQLDMALATKNDSLCKICMNELVEPQKNSCNHVFCLYCIEHEVYEAEEEGQPKATCPICGKALDDWNPEESHEAAPRQETEQDSPSEPSEAQLAAYAALGITPEDAKALKALQKQRKYFETRNDASKRGKDGRKLGDDFLDNQPRMKNSSTRFLQALDKSYPKPMVPSAKTTTVKHTILEWQKDAPDDKIIIFTQFLQEGQILGRMLQAEGFKFLYFFGEMSSKDKTTAVDIFHQNDDVKIMIASLKCGGVALNLTCANRVILIDPWWNASIENQAFGRVFRIGQEKETYLQNILVHDTIDRRMHRLQLEKTKMIQQAMQHSKSLSVQDMISLIGNLTEDKDGNPIVVADYET